MNQVTTVLSVSALLAFAGAAHAQVTIYSNNGGSGDSFTNAGPSNTGQAVGSTGWYYNNTRANGVVGINNTFARSGNGSAFLSTVDGNSKADIEFLPNATSNANGNYSSGNALGLLSQLSSFSYDWYRASGGDAASHLHPSLRLQVYSPTTGQFGNLVFERIYNGFSGAAPTDTWQSDDIFANRSSWTLWSTGTLPGAFSDYSRTLDWWMNNPNNYLVTGVSTGVGSGWGSFVGAVDNVTFGFNGNNTTYNFEVVPAPGAAAALGLCGLGALRRRR